MEIFLTRDIQPTYTGGLFRIVADVFGTELFHCKSLEDPVREIGPSGEGKVYGKTAIPAGRYRVVLSFSKRFNQIMPEILGVPHFSGVRIHWGNTVVDTDGCPLVGETLVGSFLGSSKKAYARMMKHLEAAHERKEKMYITIA